jgi:tRNA pseudouridine55 synthase
VGGRRDRRPVHGWLVIDKPPRLTSAAVVAILRRVTGAAKVGHGGTLDPQATGVLPLAFGEATKTVRYAMDGFKVYGFTVRWGEKRNTDDCDGTVTAVSEVRPSEEAILEILPRFTGEIMQTPPDFSAVKVGGRRAYALARAAAAPALSPRCGFIDWIRLVQRADADHASFEVRSGKGVYMRALARDLASALGTVGHVAALRRRSVGPFSEDQALPLEAAQGGDASELLRRHLLPVGAALSDIPAVSLTEAEARRIRCGGPVAALPIASRSPSQRLHKDSIVYATVSGRPVALAQVRGGEIRPLRVLNI